MSGPIIPEPPRSADDTNPTGLNWQPSKPRRGRPWLSLLLLSGAVLMTVGAGLVYVGQSNVGQQPTAIPTQVVVIPNDAPTDVPATAAPQVSALPAVDGAPDQPAPDVLGALMLQPAQVDPPADQLMRHQQAFTIAPARPRSASFEYTIQVGDTVEKIAKHFNITQDTIIWNNEVGYVNRLQPGTTLTIPPIDGILYRPSADETIQSMADKFKVSPYAIIDSEYNKLSSANPNTMIPASLLTVMIPGGVTKKVAIYWKPQVDTRAGGGKGNVGQVRFGGGPGSCGFVSNGGGDGSIGRPLNNYTVIRGFSSYHSGIDLAIGTGTPVFAAGAGTVIFAGWSDWGYGYAIVIAHTPTLWTLYGHLSRIGVACGNFVQRGAVIGAVGSTGNSSGPHLHFETRINGDPVNPISILGGF